MNAVGGEVDRSEQVEAWRLGRLPQVVHRGGIGIRLPGGDGGGDRSGVGGELVDEEGEEGGLGVVVALPGERGVPANDELGQAAGGGFVTEAREGPTGLAEHREFGVGGRAHPVECTAVSRWLTDRGPTLASDGRVDDDAETDGR